MSEIVNFYEVSASVSDVSGWSFGVYRSWIPKLWALNSYFTVGTV